MWKSLPWKAVGNATAIRNARNASLVLARQRRERDEIEAFLASLTDTHFVKDERFSLPKIFCGKPRQG